MHVLLWTVHGPHFFARFLHDDDKKEKLMRRIDALVTGQLAKGGKITNRHKCREPPPLAPRPASPPVLASPTTAVVLENGGVEAPGDLPPAPAPAGTWDPESPFPKRPVDLQEARDAADLSGARHLLHSCCKRCRKPPKGHIMCAMAFSRPPADVTTVEQCYLCDSDPKAPLVDRALCFAERIDPPPSEKVPMGMPVSPLDTRCLSMKLQRIHLQDCFTSETNAVLQGCANTNTNVSYLTGGQDAKNQCFYLTKYTSKLPNEVTEFSPLIMKSRRDARRLEFTPAMLQLSENARAFPSVADDRADSKRISQFFLNKTLNKASGLEEVSAHQHAASLMGQKSSFQTETFGNFSVGDAARRFMSLILASTGSSGTAAGPNGGNCSSSLDESDAEDPERRTDNGVVEGGAQHDAAEAGAANARSSNVARLLIARPGDYTLSDWLDDYLYRPLCLYGQNYNEFVSVFDCRKKTEVDIGDGETQLDIPPGSVGTFEFQDSHPASGSHYLKLRKRFRTPVLQGQMPPPLGHWEAKGAKRDLFIRFYAFHSIPFWLPDGPQPPAASVGGLRSAEHYLTPAKFSSLMASWQMPSSPWIFRARYAKHKNMIHMQHTPFEARVIGAKYRYYHVMPWKEMEPNERPPSESVSDAGAIPCDSESDAIARMIAYVNRGASVANAPFKRLREKHRGHIVKTFENIYPPPRHRAGADVCNDGELEDPAAHSPCLSRAVEQRCPWDAWSSKNTSCFQKAGPQEAESLQPEVARSRWAPHSMRGHLEADSILLCATNKSWRIEIPPDLLLSDPSFPPSQFPTSPATLYLHSGFSSSASRAGVDLSSAQLTAGGLLEKLLDAKATFLAGVPPGLELVEPGSVEQMILSSGGLGATGLEPAQLEAAEAWRSTVRGFHVFAQFLKLAVTSDTPVVFGEGDRVLRSDLNPEQTTFYDRVIAAYDGIVAATGAAGGSSVFKADSARNPKLHLLCGRAGTGKTYVTAAIQNHLELMGVRCAAVAFMWSAVYQMKVTCEKHSIHSFLGMNIDDLQPERIAKMDMKMQRKLKKLKDRLEGIGALFVDEISTTAPVLLYALDKVLRAILDPNEPFGGILVILLGDFGQLPPVKAPSLAQLAVLTARRNADGENHTGTEGLVDAEAARLFIGFRRMDLVTAVRSRKDKDWSVFTRRFDPSFTDPPVSPADLEKLKSMRLSPELLAQNPCLEFATAGTLTNFEANVINNLQIFRFAGRLNDPVFRTVSGVVCTGGSSEDAAEGYIAMETGACELEKFWVRGMPVVVGERPSALSPSYGIANGRHGFFHSFGFDDPATANGDWSNHPRHFNDGVVVKVPSPDYINVKFLFDKPKGENLDEWSIIVAFRAKSSCKPMEVPSPLLNLPPPLLSPLPRLPCTG